MYEVSDVKAVSWLDPKLDFKLSRITDSNWRGPTREEAYFKLSGVPTFEAKQGDGGAEAGAFNELQIFQIDVELHARAPLSTGSNARVIGQPVSLKEQARPGRGWIERDAPRFIALLDC